MVQAAACGGASCHTHACVELAGQRMCRAVLHLMHSTVLGLSCDISTTAVELVQGHGVVV